MLGSSRCHLQRNDGGGSYRSCCHGNLRQLRHDNNDRMYDDIRNSTAKLDSYLQFHSHKKTSFLTLYVLTQWCSLTLMVRVVKEVGAKLIGAVRWR